MLPFYFIKFNSPFITIRESSIILFYLTIKNEKKKAFLQTLSKYNYFIVTDQPTPTFFSEKTNNKADS